MNLIGELENARNYTPIKGPRCTVCRLLTQLPADEQQALVDAFNDTNIPHVAIGTALKNAGHYIATGTVARHRKGECNGIA